MTTYDYVFNKIEKFPNGMENAILKEDIIENKSISCNCISIETNNVTFIIKFDSKLSEDEISILETVIFPAHALEYIENIEEEKCALLFMSRITPITISTNNSYVDIGNFIFRGCRLTGMYISHLLIRAYTTNDIIEQQPTFTIQLYDNTNSISLGTYTSNNTQQNHIISSCHNLFQTPKRKAHIIVKIKKDNGTTNSIVVNNIDVYTNK